MLGKENIAIPDLLSWRYQEILPGQVSQEKLLLKSFFSGWWRLFYRWLSLTTRLRQGYYFATSGFYSDTPLSVIGYKVAQGVDKL